MTKQQVLERLQELNDIFNNIILKINIMKLKKDLSENEKKIIDNFEMIIVKHQKNVELVKNVESQADYTDTRNLKIIFIFDYMKKIALNYQDNAQKVVNNFYQEM